MPTEIYCGRRPFYNIFSFVQSVITVHNCWRTTQFERMLLYIWEMQIIVCVLFTLIHIWMAMISSSGNMCLSEDSRVCTILWPCRCNRKKSWILGHLRTRCSPCVLRMAVTDLAFDCYRGSAPSSRDASEAGLHSRCAIPYKTSGWPCCWPAF